MKNKIDHKTHMKADLSRCPQESADFEKIIMTLLMRKLNRKIKRSTITSEVKIKGSNDIADVGAELKDGWNYWEIQRAISPNYSKRIAKRDLETNTSTLIIPLKPLIKKYGEKFKELSNKLDRYILEEK